MNATYSLMVIALVTLILTLNSIWAHIPGSQTSHTQSYSQQR